MAPPDTPKRRGRKRSKRRTASTGPRHTSLSEEPRPSTLPGSPAFSGKKKRGSRGKGKGKEGGEGAEGEAVGQSGITTTITTSTTTTDTTADTTTTMPRDNKLDNLCHLLENIMLQHGTNNQMKMNTAETHKPSPAKGIRKSPPPPPAAAAAQITKKLLQSAASTSGGGGSSSASGSGSSATAASTSNATPSPSLAPTPKTELSKEELERERKARREAKKAKKKAPGKENIVTDTPPDSKQPPPSNAEGARKPKAPATPVKKGGAVAAASGAGASSVPVVVVSPSSESTSQPKPPGQDTTEQQSAEGGGGEGGGGSKSKAELRKERRELQEAQRKAKLAAKAQQEEEKKTKEKQGAEKPKAEGKVKLAGEGTRKRVRRSGSKSERKVPLLGHLPPYSPHPPDHSVNSEVIHPAVLSVGLKMKYGVIKGATARVIAMLSALKRFIGDYRTPEACDLSRDMADKLQPNVDFLAACRPHAIAMDNAIRSVKHKINKIDPATPEAQAKDELRGDIDQFIEENVILAGSTIATHATSLIHHDVLLTFGYSALVVDVVEAVVKAGGQVSVVVADYPHPPTGAAMVQRLGQLGVQTYYRLITDLSHIMSKVTKVVVEAEAVMMNGSVQALCGTASLALAAATHHKPFIVLSQTYKFCNIDLTDSLVMNELSDPDMVVNYGLSEQRGRGVLAGWRDTPNLNVVHLVYDVTPASLVTVLVTEQSVLPTSAVPVIIHRKYADILGQD